MVIDRISQVKRFLDSGTSWTNSLPSLTSGTPTMNESGLAGGAGVSTQPSMTSSYDDVRNGGIVNQSLYDSSPVYRRTMNWMYGHRSTNPGGPGGGPVEPGGASVNRQQEASEAFKQWKSYGYTDAGAYSMVAQEDGESRLGRDHIGDGGASRGRFQWDQTRRNKILEKTGIDVWDRATTGSQARFAANEEMRNGWDAGAGRAYEAIKNAQSIPQGVRAGVTDFERSGNQPADIAKRTAMGLDWQRRNLGQQAPAPSSPPTTPAPNGPEAAPEQPDLSRGGRLPQLLVPPQAPAAPAALQADNSGGSTVRISIDHNNAPEGVRMGVTTEGSGAEIGDVRVRRAMPEAGRFPRAF